MAPKVEGIRNSNKKKSQNTTKPKSDHPKKFLYVALFLLEFENDL
jgi:hypothetical protein